MTIDDPVGTVAVPGGTVTLRDARSGTSRDVALRAFEIGRTPVTARAWAADGGARSADADGDRVPARPVSWFDAVAWCNAASARAGLRPAYRVAGRRVTWDVAADGYRLPTEGEWEHAARAGSTAPTYGPLESTAWTALDDVPGPQPVAGKAPNAFGADVRGPLPMGWSPLRELADSPATCDDAPHAAGCHA